MPSNHAIEGPPQKKRRVVSFSESITTYEVIRSTYDCFYHEADFRRFQREEQQRLDDEAAHELLILLENGGSDEAPMTANLTTANGNSSSKHSVVDAVTLVGSNARRLLVA